MTGVLTSGLQVDRSWNAFLVCMTGDCVNDWNGERVDLSFIIHTCASGEAAVRHVHCVQPYR